MSNQFEYPEDREKRNAAKVKALEALLIQKGIITSNSVDNVLNHFETKKGPFNGAKIVVRAWMDAEFKKQLVKDTAKAIAELDDLPEGMAGVESEHVKAVANGDGVHNLIVCTLCSCYPWSVLGLPPYWYKDPTFRSRAAREPRAVLREFGLNIPQETEIRVWDSSAQIRWFVIPERPEGTENMTEAQLVELVTPECMMGVALPKIA